MNKAANLKILTILTVFPIISEAIALLFLPAQVPVHYNMSFQVDEYGSKFTLLILGAVVFVFGIFIRLLYKANVDKESEALVYKLSIAALVIFNLINIFGLLGAFIFA